MVVIINKLDQRLIINLIGGKNIDLLAKGTARVSEEELSSPHLQALITKGDILLVQTAKEPKEEKREEEKMEGPMVEKHEQIKRKAKK